MKVLLSVVFVSLQDHALKRAKNGEGGLRGLCAAALILMSWGCAPTLDMRALPLLPVGTTVQVSELAYAVTGTTVPEIRQSLHAGPTESPEEGSIEFQTPSLSLSYRYGQQGDHCVMTWIDIALESATQAPEWTDREAADPTLVTMWDRYITALRGQEFTRQEYLYSWAADLSRELYSIESPRCVFMPQMASWTAARINDRYAQLMEQFDEENETVVWPPEQ